MTAPATSRMLGTREVQSRCRLSARQLQWWDEKRIISPTVHEHHRRLYTEADVRLISVVAEFKRKGLSLQSMRSVIRRLKRTRLPDKGYVLTDGTTVKFAQSADQAVRLMEASDVGWRLVEITT
jgi:DNA-binding transcriptional MerR regulator